ncbi:MAG: hypothetical protein IPP96_06130 [Chitinophagaceae bacterium]|nr:hypothetical protein [Chitinophagaceae bacterium]
MRRLFIIIPLLSSISVFCQYNFYFGNIHSHTSYSDGNKDSATTGYNNPGGDYNYAKGSYHMDYLGIAEHNHYSSNNNPGMHVAHYPMGLYQADTANHTGSFVAMFGMEWGTISQGGHVVVYGVPQLIGWESGSGGWGPTNNYDIFCTKGDFTSFWPIVKNYPTAFCTLAHTQTNDYENLLDGAAYNAKTDSVIKGLAIRSGNAMSTTTNYTDPPATLYESKFLKALALGYHLGPTIDHDNHYTTFGRTNKGRTVVLATALNRDSIMAAYKAIRFYASDDWNAQVNFTINGKVMGNFITTGNSSISRCTGRSQRQYQQDRNILRQPRQRKQCHPLNFQYRQYIAELCAYHNHKHQLLLLCKDHPGRWRHHLDITDLDQPGCSSGSAGAYKIYRPATGRSDQIKLGN